MFAKRKVNHISISSTAQVLSDPGLLTANIEVGWQERINMKHKGVTNTTFLPNNSNKKTQKKDAAAAVKSLQSCRTLCDPIDGSPPGSPVPGILQARTLEWVAISFSKIKDEKDINLSDKTTKITCCRGIQSQNPFNERYYPPWESKSRTWDPNLKMKQNNTVE